MIKPTLGSMLHQILNPSRSQGLGAPTGVQTGPQPQKRWTIPERFELQARKSPDAIAVSWGEERLTYRQLDEAANQLAQYLRKRGVGPEIPVALYLERTLQMVVAILAVLKAGGAYVPIDLAYPRDRLSFMLEDAKAPVLLTQSKLHEQLPATAAEVVCIDSDWDRIASEPTTTAACQVTSDNAAYIIYTSGSTGKPKGVIVTHHNVVRLLTQTEHWYGFNANDVWPLFHSYAFDVSVWELWGSLFYGGRLITVPYLVTRSPGKFYDLLAREQATVLCQTPSAFRQFIWAEQVAPVKHDLALRYVICAGEALELQSLKPWFDRHGDERPCIVNMYGITETTVHSTYRVIRRADLTSGVGSVIGVPLPDLQIYLVDEELKQVPLGTPGEICVGGDGVARGYLNRPELTAKRFLPDPLSPQPGARLYLSGDLAQVNSHGEMEYLGRMDHQVKIRGFRVELGEIESALNRHSAVRESVVIASEAAAGDKRLVAYIVPVKSAPTVTELRAFLGRQLPDYMLPAVCIFLESLPLTTNGKVDRRALPSPDGARPQLQTRFVAPATPAEEALARIWSDVLEVNQVGVNDNFFELGGDSIRCITILARAAEQGLHFSIEQIFRHPTIAGLAACAQPGARKETPATQPFSLISAEERASLPAGITDAYPLSRLQLGMFYSNELDPVSAIYHDVFSYRIDATFERDALARAIQGLARRHPLLRTSFHLAGFSQPLQLVHSHVEIPFTVEDLRPFEPAKQDEQLVKWVETEKRRVFDRAVPPLFRFHVQWRDEKTFQLILSFHHSCLDGWSLAALITELLQDYAAILHGLEPANTTPRIAYRDFVALEQQTFASPESRAFWNGKLKNASPQIVPRWPKSYCAGGQEQNRGPELQIDQTTLVGLKQLAHSSGVPLRTVLLAAHLRVMGLLYGQADVLTGLITNGRPEALDGEKLIGLFLNNLPLRLWLDDGTWRELVQQTFRAEQELLPHRRFPLAELQKINGGRPLFETSFDFVHFHVYRALEALGEINLAEGHYFEANSMAIYTTFMLDATSTRLEVHIDYDPNLVARQQSEEITGYYVGALQAMAVAPEARYETFSPLPEPERHRMLVEWNATTEEYARNKSLAQLFEERVAETADAVALVFGEQSLNYRQLNERAERLARELRKLEVQPEELVGLYVERGPDMVVGLLGILKAGAAYVPLDPTYPAERLAFMLEDAGLRLLLTQQNLQAALPRTDAQLLCIDALSLSLTPDFSPVDVGTHEAETRLAYVIYTSGSTGKPKGVQVTQQAVINLLTSVGRKLGFTSKDNLLAVTTLSFDIAGLELYLPLITGAKLTLASREQAGDGTQLAALLNSSGATVMQATPATWRLVLEAGWSGNQNLAVLCGGEALKRNLADELLARAKAVWNFYGPTETTIWSTAGKVESKEPILIGRPLANTQLYILDQGLRPVPVGTVGELHIGGDGLARGYWNRPELTAEKFIPHPFSDQPGRRLYKTGDLARFLPDGQVECLGRVDHQVKVRGFRIELGEIEAVLRQHAGIAEAVVTARDDSFGEKRLVGYIISKNGPPDLGELRDFVKRKLPPYMVPAQFVTLEQFPLTPNGKIDLRQLPAPDTVLANNRNLVPPRTGDERAIADIWREVLECRQVGIDDNFFELGGDSLSATRAFARINRNFGTSMTLREVLEHPTIRSLGEVVSASKGKAPAARSVIPRQPRKDSL
jgi:amino acid adenylation domain-containing protein